MTDLSEYGDVAPMFSPVLSVTAVETYVKTANRGILSGMREFAELVFFTAVAVVLRGMVRESPRRKHARLLRLMERW